MKKRRKKSDSEKLVNKLYNENWELCHEIVELRDGSRKCVLCGGSPCDLDHSISRTVKTLFFETKLQNYLCKKHHQRKSMAGGGSVDKSVDLITIRRIGKSLWEEFLLKSWKTCPEFKTVWYQEQENIRLKEERAMLLVREAERDCGQNNLKYTAEYFNP